MGSYYANFRIIRACLAAIPPLYHSLDLPYTCPTMHTSSRPTRSSSLCIGGSYAEEPDLGQTCGGSGHSTIIIDRVPSAGPSSPSGKGKSKVNEIKYPSGSDYLRVSMKYADTVGPSQVEPFYEKTFITRYRHPLGIQIWCLDLHISYVVQVPKKVCFFEAAF